MPVPTLEPLAPARAADDGKFVSVDLVGGVPMYVPRSVDIGDVSGAVGQAALDAEVLARATAIVQEQSDRAAADALLDSQVRTRFGTTADRLALTPGPGDRFIFLAEDDNGGTPWLWNGFVWENMLGWTQQMLNPRGYPYNWKYDALKITDLSIDPATPTKAVSAATVFTAADMGKYLLAESAGVGQQFTVSIASGSNVLYLSQAKLVITAASGAYGLGYGADVSANNALAWNADAAAIQAVLRARSTVGATGMTVTGTWPTFTITINPTIASGGGDISLLSRDQTNLVGAINGAAPSAKITTTTWDYGVVGLRVQIPGAGAAGGVLTGYIGSIDSQNSWTVALYDTAPKDGVVQGNAANASTSVVGANGRVLNWGLFVIGQVDPADVSGKTIIFSNTSLPTGALSQIDPNVLAPLSGLEVRYGTAYDPTQLMTDAVAQNKGIDWGVGGAACLTKSATLTLLGGKGIKITGDAEMWAMVTDSMTDGGGLTVTGTSNTDAGRAVRVSADGGWTWSVPAAHNRGLGGAVGVIPKTGWGVTFRWIDYLYIDIRIRTCYGIGITSKCNRYGLIAPSTHVDGSWADGINISNVNQTGGYPGSDMTDMGLVTNAGDAMHALDHYVANIVTSTLAQGERMRRNHFLNVRGRTNRQGSLATGMGFHGGIGCLIAMGAIEGTNGASLDLHGGPATNCTNDFTVTTPGTGAVLTRGSAPNNITAGATGTTRTQMRVFKNDGSDTYWIGEVVSIAGSGTILTLEAATGYAATCPFTGAGSTAQWGLSTDGFRFGSGGIQDLTVLGQQTRSSAQNPSGDSTKHGGVRIHGGQVSTERITNVRMSRIDAVNSYQSGITFDSLWTSTTSNVPPSALVDGVTIDGHSVKGTGYGPLTATKPWPAVNIIHGSNIRLLNGDWSDTFDGGLALSGTNANSYGGIIEVDNITMDNIGRSGTTANPIAAAIDFGTLTGFVAMYDRIKMRNTLGTNGGTQYVVQYGVSKLPAPASGALPKRGSFWTDIPIGSLPNLLGAYNKPTSGQHAIVIGQKLYESFGSPEGVIPAPKGALCSDTNTGDIYRKTTDWVTTGWVLLASATGLPSPEVDLGVYTHDPTAPLALAAWPGANTGVWKRLRGSGTITGLAILPGTLSGNVLVAVYANTGAGVSARPSGAALGASASTAMSGLSANVKNTITFLSAFSLAVTHGTYWAFLVCDNTTATFARIASLTAAQSGECHSVAVGSLSAPTPSSPGGSAYTPAMWGV